MGEPAFDLPRSEAFRRRLEAALDGAALALALSLGHRAGLFDVMARMAPATSAAIAEQAGLVERYVREWLGAMVAAGIVAHDAGAGTHWLPPEHAAALTRAARPHNLAGRCQWIAALGAVEDQVLDCFERGGHVPESAYPRLRALRADERAAAAPAQPLLGSFLYTIACLHGLPADPALEAAPALFIARS